MQGAPGDPHDFGNRRFRNRFRQQGLNIRFAAREFRCPQGTFGTADVFAFRTCRGEALFGPLGNEVAFNLRRLLLDSRVVHVLRSSILIVDTLASLQPFFFNGLRKAGRFLDNVRA